MQSSQRSQIPWKMVLAAMLCAIVFLSGCATRTVLVQPGEPVRLRQPIKKAKVWVADQKGKEIPGEVDLPEGWYALPDPGSKQ